MPAELSAQCGSVTVPLDPANPALGATTVAFAVLPRRDQSRPSLGTLLGPASGGPTIEFAPQLAATFGRDGADIERSTLWTDAAGADAFREAGVTLFQTELTARDGYDLTSLKEVLTWRDNG